jgi:hypothetical protein
MRTLLLPLAVVALLALVGPFRAEFDAAGVASAKTKASGAAFDSGLAANPRARQAEYLRLDGVRRAMAARVWLATIPALPRPTIKRGSNIPRPKR